MRPPIINVMDGAARKAARSLIHDFNEVEQLQVSRKGPANFVSEADRRAEEIIKWELSRAHPDFAFLMEESGASGPADATDRWIVDPLDGTTNFLHGIPHFAISIAHEQRGEIVAGMVYEPTRDEVFWAARGEGCFLNNRRLRVSARRDLGSAILATGVPFGNRPGREELLEVLGPVMDLTAGLRRLGTASLDLAYVAAGRFDAFWEFGLSPWDVAAGMLLVREAGGMVSEIDGRSDPLNGGTILASNSEINDTVRAMLQDAIRSVRKR
jgi:myo-inositol-1(or 4)-monophosphatase